MTGVSPLGSFLLPTGYARPGVAAVLREGRVVSETGRYAWDAVGARRRNRHAAYCTRTLPREAEPVVLVPGFLAGDASLAVLGRALRRAGLRTYRSHIHANVGCTREAAERLEGRLEEIARRRGARVQVVGHSLGGMLARGVAARRPDLVAGVVTMGSPVLAPGAHHLALSASVELLVRLSGAGLGGLMTSDCVGGACARQSFEENRAPLAAEVSYTALYSRSDGVVDWRACLDPGARVVEVSASHLGMAVDPRVASRVLEALARHREQAPLAAMAGGHLSVVGLDRGESA